MNYKIIMVRRVKDDFEAMLMCRAVEAKANGQIISVVYEPQHASPVSPTISVSASWHVFARVKNKAAIDAIDKEFDKLISK